MAGPVIGWPVGGCRSEPVVVAVAVIAVAALVNTALLAGDDQIPLIERGLTGRTVQ